MPDPDTDLTSAQLAARLQVNVESIRRWAAAGRIPHMSLPGGRLRFNLTDVRQALAAKPDNIEATP